MKALVTGVKGQLGYDVIKALDGCNIECLGIDKNDVDITDEQSVKAIIINYEPDVVIHCAAYTAVDKAEDEKELCYRINVIGTKNIAQACKMVRAKMLYISTDYIFDGYGKAPYEVLDNPNPVNYYGETKYQGELKVQAILNEYFIVRTSWVFGMNGGNFVKTMLRLAEEGKEISVVSDQFGSPTYTYDLANFLAELVNTQKYGIYHVTNEGYCSWYEFACEIFRQRGLNIAVNAVNSDKYPTKANRPKDSRLSKKALKDRGFVELRHWKVAISDFLY